MDQKNSVESIDYADTGKLGPLSCYVVAAVGTSFDDDVVVVDVVEPSMSFAHCVEVLLQMDHVEYSD